ncbi:hypothetical protein V5O48_019014, partial [Marasmius crinis-equi]
RAGKSVLARGLPMMKRFLQNIQEIRGLEHGVRESDAYHWKGRQREQLVLVFLRKTVGTCVGGLALGGTGHWEKNGRTARKSTIQFFVPELPPCPIQTPNLKSLQLKTQQTRSGFYYSPYLLSSDVYVDPNITVDALLYTALNLRNDPFGSPLTTPPSSRCASPKPAPFAQPPSEVTIPVQVQPQDGLSGQNTDGSSKKKRKRRKRKKNVGPEEEAGNEEEAKEADKGESVEERSAPGSTQQRSHVQRRLKRQKTEQPLLLTQSDESLEKLARKHASRLFPSSVNAENASPLDDLRFLAQSTGYQGNPFIGLGNPEADVPAPEN